MMDTFWADKLKPLVDRDHFVREALVSRGVLSDAYHKEMEKVHIENANKLKVLIEKNGFPVLSNAGEEGVKFSWLIIHHAISLPDFMRQCLVEIRLAAAAKDYPLDLLAYLEDRVCFFEGRPQLYGTNWDWLDSELQPTPVERPEELNMRRKAVGLPPMDYPAKATVTHDRPPKDPQKKAQEYQEWLKRTGWRA